jgi:Tol biopolymer transport system component
MIDEREIREMLERRAATISATPTEVPKAIRRARRRLTRNAAVGTLVGLAVLAGVLAGVRTIQTAPTPADPPTPIPATLGSLAYGLDGDIYVADWDGSNAVKIADGRPPSECRDIGEYWWEGPIWSPDGRYLAYHQANCEGDGPPDWWRDVVISDPEGNVVASFPGEGWAISWSPDSTRVVVWVRIGRTIGVYGPDGERQALLTVPREIQGLAPGPMAPRWSPDGASLLYRTFEIPLDGSPPIPRTEGGTSSPDGSRVAYTTGRSLIIASGHLIGPGARLGSLAWSPTGDRIAFTWGSRGRPTELLLLDVATGTVTLLTETDGSDILSTAASAPFEFSPEGDRILFSKTEDEGAAVGSLWSVNVDGSNLRRLVARTDWADWFTPSPTP